MEMVFEIENFVEVSRGSRKSLVAGALGGRRGG
jgi:hypothetical protein